jgi:hypothetical protein
MKTIIEIIASHNFVATGEQVERLANAVVAGHQADGTYLRVILAHMQAKLGKPRRGRRSAAEGESAEAVLDTIHETLYPHICKGVGNGDIDTTERNRRATFARSAASTVRYFIREGGDVRTVDVTTVTKAGLRAAVQPAEAEAPEGETRVQRGFRKATQALVRSAQRLLARGDPDEAREQIEQTLEVLEGLLAAEPKAAAAAQPRPAAQDFGGTTTTIAGRPRAGTRGTPANAPMLHRGA